MICWGNPFLRSQIELDEEAIEFLKKEVCRFIKAGGQLTLSDWCSLDRDTQNVFLLVNQEMEIAEARQAQGVLQELQGMR